MWKVYAKDYLKQNRISGISITAAAFIATVFLSLLCSLFYNVWIYEVKQTIADEGSWEARIEGDLDEEDLAFIENFSNVDQAVINQELSDESKLVIDVTFQERKTIYQDMVLMMQRLDLEEEAVIYHEVLLSQYLIHNPQDKNPPMLLIFFLVLLGIVSVSLVLIIHNSFAVSMNARIHQFGIFSGIGATPAQIYTCLMIEAFMLCMLPMAAGVLTGTAVSAGILEIINALGERIAGRQKAEFHFSWIVFLAALLLSLLTVLFSAWIPARRMSRLTPLEAIKNTKEWKGGKKKSFPILSKLFGIEGELAGLALHEQRKALRTSTLSLTLSFLGFTVMLCFLTLASISTNHTYFERYQEIWDVMVTVKDTPMTAFESEQEIKGLEGAESCVIYQKAQTMIRIPKTEISKELNGLGGPEQLAGADMTADKFYIVKSPLIIMDDESFLQYAQEIGAAQSLQGSIVINRIWDSINSNFRYPKYLPFIKESGKEMEVQGMGQETVKLPVLAYTQMVPPLREEYEHNTLVQVIPLSLWKDLKGRIGTAEEELYINIQMPQTAALEELNDMEAKIVGLVDKRYELETENRIQEKINNDQMISGYMLFEGAFCSLLALIGIANVFSNAMGFLRQRNREFARYFSIGMTPAGMKKMFCMEVLIIAGRPVLITLPVTALVVAFMITASYLDPMEFIKQAPVIPVILFILTIFAFVSLAYYIGAGRLLHADLSDVLRSDVEL